MPYDKIIDSEKLDSDLSYIAGLFRRACGYSSTVKLSFPDDFSSAVIDLEDEIDDLEYEIYVLERDISNLEDEIDDLTETNTELNEYFGQFKNMITGSSPITKLPSEITTIRNYAFENAKIGNLKLPVSITSIGIGAFSYVTGDSNSIINMESCSQIDAIPSECFSYADIGTIRLPSVKSVGKESFYGVNFNYTYSPSNQWQTYVFYRIKESIGDAAFADISYSGSLYFASTLKTIGKSAFYHVYMSSITFPVSLQSIGSYAFAECYSLKTVTFKGTPSSIASDTFEYSDSLTTINVPWASGAVAGAPWGATNATINYNYVG